MIHCNDKLRLYYQNNKIKLLVSFISTYLFGLSAHAYGLLNNIFSHDALNALYADSVENYAKISVGRFMVPVIRYIFRGQFAISWLIGIVAFFYLAVAVYIIVKMFDINSRLSIVLISAIMVTNNTVTGCVATYIHEFDLNMFALMLAVFGVYLWEKGKKYRHSALSALLIVFSLGIYQSNLTVVTMLMISCIILDLMKGYTFKTSFLKGIKGVGIITVSALLYYALSKLFVSMAGINIQSRADALNVSDALATEVSYINGFNSMIFYEIQKIINPVSVLPKAIVIVANVLVLLIGIVATLILIHKIDKRHIKEKILSLILIALIPVSVGYICIITKGELHDIMTFALWLVPVLIVVLINKLNDSVIGNTLYNATAVVSVICIAVIVLNSILVANTAYLKKDLEHDATLSAMTRVTYDLSERDDYIPGETKVYFVGADFLQCNPNRFNEVEKIIGLNYHTAIGVAGKEWYYCSFEKYFLDCLGQPLNHTDRSFITDEIHNSIMEMPSFPKKGYIKMFGDVLVIKMN